MFQPPAILDLRRTDSPMLPLLVRRALAELVPGQELEVLLASPQWVRDLPLILRRAGERCLDCQPRAGHWCLRLARGRGRPGGAKRVSRSRRS